MAKQSLTLKRQAVNLRRRMQTLQKEFLEQAAFWEEEDNFIGTKLADVANEAIKEVIDGLNYHISGDADRDRADNE